MWGGAAHIDGDGLADHVLKRDGDSEVRARKNAIGKANLLWRVHRPLGGSVELDYWREGNLVVPRQVARECAGGRERAARG
ncbi:hypothetical protein BE20_32760 [Sorangium cellulosum]|uniref:Uncharacterized protein n=1 Tax=Sorangium cellulosum TaxID=56 RepID=A0A150SEP1_SORCE|nr:hypothetical protein BE18_05430 [Sorangium cellulosum]KYF99106.1 hypothetical protein BE20_32760 [Sorangium cellulosum]